jgi:hypothetical protein
MHFVTDLVLGAVLILSAFIFGFSDKGGGHPLHDHRWALELITAVSTRWDPLEAEEYHTHSSPPSGAH